jgi:hypothetical protein
VCTLVFGLGVGLGACNGDRSAAKQHTAGGPSAPVRASAPTSEREFLDVLAPLPGSGVRIVYAVDGPGSLDGTLEVLAKPGGWRRENWSLSHPGPTGEASELRGSTIQTPELLWSGVDGESGGVKAPAPLAALAAAYLALDDDARATAAANLRRWHEDLSRARVDHPGDVRELAGTRCLQMRVAAQELCLWEETGLALEYRGAEFSVVATRVELDAEIAADAFTLPASADAAPEVPAPTAEAFDPHTSMRALVEGRFGPLAPVLTPGLRLPMPVDDAPK